MHRFGTDYKRSFWSFNKFLQKNGASDEGREGNGGKTVSEMPASIENGSVMTDSRKCARVRSQK